MWADSRSAIWVEKHYKLAGWPRLHIVVLRVADSIGCWEPGSVEALAEMAEMVVLRGASSTEAMACSSARTVACMGEIDRRWSRAAVPM